MLFTYFSTYFVIWNFDAYGKKNWSRGSACPKSYFSLSTHLLGAWYLMIRSLFPKTIPPRWEKYRMLRKALKFSNFIVVIIQVSSKKLVKAMLQFVFVLKLRWVKLLFIVVFSKGHWVILLFMVKTFKSTYYSVLLYYELCLRINVMYQSNAHNWNRKCHLYSQNRKGHLHNWNRNWHLHNWNRKSFVTRYLSNLSI